jgi:AraC-like DNA-binding protein
VLIALLPSNLLRHVEFVIGRDEQVLAARSWLELESMLETNPATVALIDPSLDGTSRTVEFERLRTSYPSLPVIAYVPLTPAAFRSVTELSKLGLEHVVLYSHDDSAERFITMIDKLRSSPITDLFLDSLRPDLSRLPVVIVQAIEEMFAEPHRFSNAQELALGAKVSVVRLYRAFRGAQLAAPRKMIIAAKLLRAFAHLSDPGQSVAGVSRKLAYRTPRILGEHTSEVFGINPSRMRTHLTGDYVVKTLLRFVAKEREKKGTTAGHSSAAVPTSALTFRVGASR